MKKTLMPMTRFDQSRIGKQVLYIFPWPHGLRCLARIEYDPIEEWPVVTLANTDSKSWPDIADFCPDVTEAIAALYRPLFDEPDPKITRNGRQVVFPTLIIDLILHDRTTGDDRKDGSADVLNAHMEDYVIIGAPAPTGTLCALILCVMTEDEHARGSTRQDIWSQRSWLTRGLYRAGLRNPYSHPRPILRQMTQSPRQWEWESNGIASDLPDVNWQMIDNAFNRSYRGVLVVDVWQPWAVNGNAFKVMTEEDVEV